ncbi:MAG TPA: tRNA lysidine(34) synthetase TilS [Bryobacteraceae bacterium]|nr:tRNA lysidine(34) synthetase TilS [Bryobacteraceae bacterium]
MSESVAQHFVRNLERHSMLPAGARLGVAVSGGADSVVLLELLRQCASRFAAKLTVLHVNHGLRGAESDADQEFVAELARAAGLPLLAARLEPSGEDNLEQETRQLRRRFFLSHGFDRIALGHTRSDQAETVLHRFLRGAGPAGLAAIRPVTPEGFMRPLLSFSRNEVREWARAHGLRWREDSSNADPRFTRNRIRNVVLPTLASEFNPNLEAVLAGTAELLQGEEEYWNEEVERIYPIFTKRTRLGSFFQVDHLNSLHLALRRRLIRRALAEVRSAKMRGLDFEHVEAVLALCGSEEGHDRVIVPGADALRSYDGLLLMPAGRLGEEPRGYQFQLKLQEWQRLPAGAGEICVARSAPGLPVCDTFKKESGVEQVFLAEQALGQLLRVRNWEPGDELQRSGHRSAEKIKNLFQEHHIKLWERRHWPVVVSGDRIIWTRTFGVARDFASAGGPDALLLTYRTGE